MAAGTELVAWISSAKPQELAEYIEGIKAKNVVALGTDEVFVLRDSKGEIRAFKGSVTLTAANGGLIQPVMNGPWTISAQGYEMLAEGSGAQCIFPTEISVGGKIYPNPYLEKNENGQLVAVHVRAVAFRLTPKGLPQSSDWTTNLDVVRYKMIDFLSKITKYPQAFLWLPKDEGKPKTAGTWAEYDFDEMTSVWVNTQHTEAVGAFRQILNREKKAVDVAQTFARRNALKHLLGLQKTPDGKASWTVPVICYMPVSGGLLKWDMTTYANLKKTVNDVNSSGFEVKTGIETVTLDGVEVTDDGDVNIDAADAADIQPDDENPDNDRRQGPDAPKETSMNGAVLSDDDRKTLASYQEVLSEFPDETRMAAAGMNIDLKKHINPDQAAAILAAVEKSIGG